MLTPADIRRLTPEAYEFLWRTILRRDHGGAYKHVDAYGIDCLTDGVAYQLYHHQGAAWSVVQGKFREDVAAAKGALAARRYAFDEWVFITTFSFKDPEQRTWLEEQRAKALPLSIVTWGDEDLCDRLARHPDLATLMGLGDRQGVAAIVAQGGPGGGHGIHIEGGVSITDAPPAARPAPDPLAPQRWVEEHGILWGLDEWRPVPPFCVGCFTSQRRWVPMSCSESGPVLATRRTYACPLGHPPIVLVHPQGPPMTAAQMARLARLFSPPDKPAAPDSEQAPIVKVPGKP